MHAGPHPLLSVHQLSVEFRTRSGTVINAKDFA